jgi:hypothetical protein
MLFPLHIRVSDYSIIENKQNSSSLNRFKWARLIATHNMPVACVEWRRLRELTNLRPIGRRTAMQSLEVIHAFVQAKIKNRLIRGNMVWCLILGQGQNGFTTTACTPPSEMVNSVSSLL